MARNVVLASVAPPRRTENPGTGQDAVEGMIRHWRQQIEPVLPDKPDLILLPECCDSYPAQSPDERVAYYRRRANQVRDFLAGVAREHHCYIGYAAVRESGNGVWGNALELLDRRGGSAGTYFKNHVTIPEGESGVHSGSQAPLINCDFGTVACAICFDLNFDTLRLQYRNLRPDLILFSSVYHGGLMFNYWAYSCRAYMLSSVAGQASQILSPLGHSISSTTNYHCYVVARVNLDSRIVHLDYHEEKLLSMKRKYGPEVTIYDPGLLGSVLVTSESDKRSADDLLKEFGMEPLDEYLERSLRFQKALRPFAS